MITNENWSDLARTLATDSDPLLHSPAAMGRAMQVFEPYIIRVPTPVGKYHARNNCALLHFKRAEEKEYVEKAIDRYLEECKKLNKKSAEGRWLMLVAWGKLRRACEEVKSTYLGDLLHEAVMKGYAGVGAFAYKTPIARCVRYMCKNYGYTRDDISIIWGGNDVFNAKTRLTQEEMQKLLLDMASGKPVKKKLIRQIEAQLIQSEEETAEIEATKEEDLRLGNQTREARQREIDRFQTGKSKVCLFTFSAGGVGLSLHHTDKDDKGNPVQLRPRRTYLTPVYSAQDFVQALGRAHRSIFSLSDTEQTILFFAGTIEVQVMERVKIKLRCLSKVIQQRESWVPLIDNETDDTTYAVDNVDEAAMAEQAMMQSEEDEDES